MWNWGIVYVMAIVTVAMGAVAGMQAYGRREIAAQLEQTQMKLDELMKSRHTMNVEATTARQQADANKAAIEEERDKRAALEVKAAAAVEHIARLEEQRQKALREAAAAEEALRREAKLREDTEDRLKHALEGLAAAKVELDGTTVRRRPGLAGVKVPSSSKGEITTGPETTGGPAVSEGGSAVENKGAEPPNWSASVPGSPVGTEGDEKAAAADPAGALPPKDGPLAGLPAATAQAKSTETFGGPAMAGEESAAKMGETAGQNGPAAVRPHTSGGPAAEISATGRAVDGNAGKPPESVARVNGADAAAEPSDSRGSTETAKTDAGPSGEKSAAGSGKKRQTRRSANDDDRHERRVRSRSKPEGPRETSRPPTAIFRPY